MSVIPLTLTLSLCLVGTFLIFFFREQSRRRFSSTESESLLPLSDETSLVAAPTARSPSPAPCPSAGRCSGTPCGKHVPAASSATRS